MQHKPPLNTIEPIVFRPNKFLYFIFCIITLGFLCFSIFIAIKFLLLLGLLLSGMFLFVTIFFFIALTTDRVKLVLDTDGITSYAVYKKLHLPWDEIKNIYTKEMRVGVYGKVNLLLAIDKSGKEHGLQASGVDREKVIEIYKEMLFIQRMDQHLSKRKRSANTK